jgi:hypothetical protein
MILPFIIHVPLLFFLAYLLRKYYFAEPLSFFFWPGLLLKLVTGLAIGLLYLFFKGDTWELFDQAVRLNNFLLENPKEYLNAVFFNNYSFEIQNEVYRWYQPRTIFFIKIISIVNLITLNNYWITSLYFSFFSFIGLWVLGNTLIKIYKVSALSVIISFLIFPSFILWTSGILKESITIGSIAFIISIALNIIDGKQRKYLYKLIWLFFLIYVAWELKFFYIAILVPALISYFIITFISKKFPHLKKTIILLLFLFFFSSIVILGIIIHPSLNLDYLIFIIFESYTVILNVTHFSGAHHFQFDNLTPNLLSLIKHSPEALLTGLFRPFPWEIQINFTVILGIENGLVIVLTFFLLIKKFSLQNKHLYPIVFAALVYIFITATLMAFISPNWGTLSRYKAGYLPFLLLLITNNNPLISYLEQKLFYKKNQ